MIMQHVNSPAPIRVAEENGVSAFGNAVDMREYGPTATLTSMMFDWAPYYIQRVQAVLDETWSSGDTWAGIGPGMVTLAPLNERVPVDIRERVEAEMAALGGGAFHPFAGPLNRQDGSPWKAEGETPADEELYGMDFYVEGIDGSLPT